MREDPEAVLLHGLQGHARNLVGLEVSFAGTEPVFAGQSAQFRIAVANRSKNPRHRIRLYLDDVQSVHANFDIPDEVLASLE